MPGTTPPSPLTPELLVATFAPSGEVAFRNAAWEATFGASEEPWSRLAAEDRRQAAECLAEAARGLLVTNQVFPVPTRGREEPLPLLLHFLPVPLPGRAGEPAVQAVTVTGEVLAEPESWTASQTYRHRMETLGRMTMGIAHDFNNLLSGILGYAELMKNQLREDRIEDAAGFADYLRTVEQAALDGAALVRRIQQYIRQEKQTHHGPVDLPTLIEDAVTLTRPYWYNEPRRQGIAIEVERDLQPVPPVLGSDTELREVLINLILNAVQAMPEGGTITLQTRHEPGQGVRIRVADTGTGMSERVRARIFEPLFTTKGEHGTGMGLAVSYGILQEHEGTITVASDPGRGTRFDLLLPSAEGAVAGTPEAAAEAPGRKARILVVDDEQMVRSVLTKLLSLRGHTIRQAASGAEALSIAETEPFDLVFTDHGMPEMNGRQLARALRRRYPDLPIVLLTGDTEAGEVDQDVDVVLTKPFKLDQLETTIQSLI